MTALKLGPLMSAVVDAQRRQADALRYPEIEVHASHVTALARTRRADLLWPVDSGAHKLSGVVEVDSRGRLEVRSWITNPAGRVVLMLASVGVSGADLAREAAALRAAGARAVHAAAIDAACECDGLDSFSVLSRPTSVARSA